MGGLVTTAYFGWPTMASFIEATGVLHSAGFSSGPPLHQAIGYIKHPCNLNLGWGIRWLFDRTGLHPSFAANLAAAVSEVVLVAAAFAATIRIDSRDPDWCGFSVWIVTATLISPIAWNHFLACFVPVFVGLAAAERSGGLPRVSAWMATVSYLLVVSWPRADGMQLIFMGACASLTQNRHVLGMLNEVVPLSLALIWLAAWSWRIEATRVVAIEPGRAATAR